MIDIRRGEILLGFFIRAGAWIDGIEILTSLGRKSGLYGNANGGSGYVCFLLIVPEYWPRQIGLFFFFFATFRLTCVLQFRHTLIPPLGYKIAGLSGSSGPWIDGLSIVIMH